MLAIARLKFKTDFYILQTNLYSTMFIRGDVYCLHCSEMKNKLSYCMSKMSIVLSPPA